MYIVQWCDHEGNLQERRFEIKQDADLGVKLPASTPQRLDICRRIQDRAPQ